MKMFLKLLSTLYLFLTTIPCACEFLSRPTDDFKYFVSSLALVKNSDIFFTKIHVDRGETDLICLHFCLRNPTCILSCSAPGLCLQGQLEFKGIKNAVKQDTGIVYTCYYNYTFFIFETPGKAAGISGDVAEKKTAYQSTGHREDDFAVKAVDGIYPGPTWNNPYTCLQTSEEGLDHLPYLLVDLGYTYMVLAANISNRLENTGGVDRRLHDIEIRVGFQFYNETNILLTGNSMCYPYYKVVGINVFQLCTVPLPGRYVSVQIIQPCPSVRPISECHAPGKLNNILHICELDVYGLLLGN